MFSLCCMFPSYVSSVKPQGNQSVTHLPFISHVQIANPSSPPAPPRSQSQCVPNMITQLNKVNVKYCMEMQLNVEQLHLPGSSNDLVIHIEVRFLSVGASSKVLHIIGGPVFRNIMSQDIRYTPAHGGRLPAEKTSIKQPFQWFRPCEARQQVVAFSAMAFAHSKHWETASDWVPQRDASHWVHWVH